MPNELDNFLSDIQEENNEADILEAPLNPEKVNDEDPKVEEEDEDDGLKPRNRREKRLMRKLDAERESSIYLASKLEALEEAKKMLSSEEADYLKGLERIYGTDSQESIMATELLKKAIVGAREDAENRAYERMQTERQNEQQKVKQAEQELEDIIDDIEDTFNVELTEAQEKAYFQLLQKMSPKDRSGEVISLADPHAVFEIFSDRLNKKADNRAKSLSSRSMVQSGATKDSTLSDDVLARTLQEAGII